MKSNINKRINKGFDKKSLVFLMEQNVSLSGILQSFLVAIAAKKYIKNTYHT